jgi:RNA polymerase sigma factor (sigma-70 family)
MSKFELAPEDPLMLPNNEVSDQTEVNGKSADIVGINDHRVLNPNAEPTIQADNQQNQKPTHSGDEEPDEEQIIDDADAPFIRLEKLYGNNIAVQREVDRVRKNLARQPTFHPEDNIADYLSVAGNYETLTKPDVEDLYAIIEPGIELLNSLSDQDISNISPDDKAALIATTIAHQTLIVSNLRLVISWAKKYNKHPGAIELSDLIEEGNLGLMHSIAMFNVHKGFKFSTYATWWIRQAISRGIAKKARIVKVPVLASEEAERLSNLTEQLTYELGRRPTIAELMDITRLKKEKIITYKNFGPYHIDSLDAPLESGSEFTLLDLVGSDRENPGLEQKISAMLDIDELQKLFDNPEIGLTDEERVLVCMRFGFSLEPFRDLVFTREFKKRIIAVSVREIEELRPKNGVYSLVLIQRAFHISSDPLNIKFSRIMNRFKQHLLESEDNK